MVGGPAYDDYGREFTPGLYVKNGYIMTSRGCPNNCWFCSVPKREGDIRELKIKDGYNVLDSNLLACSDTHIKKVFSMLSRQNNKPKFTGGLEAKLIKPWIANEIHSLNPDVVYFAYDTPDDYEPLLSACRMLKDCGELPNKKRNYRCYVLIGYKDDTISKAESRLQSVLDLGLLPMAMLIDNGINQQSDQQMWRKFRREWANPTIGGTKLSLSIAQKKIITA
jgi:hypothetical protein